MTSNRRLAPVQKIQPRPGEGHVVDVVMTAAADGAEATSSIDLSGMPVPDRRFTCDAVGLDHGENAVRLLFAQKQPVGAGILSMLVVSMSPESVGTLMTTITPEFRNALEKGGVTIRTPARITNFSETPTQSVILTSSIVMVGYSGLNGCMDFYYASPFAVQHMGTVKKLSVEAVVRVNLPTTVMFALLDALKPVAEQLTLSKVLSL